MLRLCIWELINVGGFGITDEFLLHIDSWVEYKDATPDSLLFFISESMKQEVKSLKSGAILELQKMQEAIDDL